MRAWRQSAMSNRSGSAGWRVEACVAGRWERGGRPQRRIGWSAALALLLSWAWPGIALAHRGPALVLSLLAWQDDAARVLRLNEGLAVRNATGWRYVCPALWRADDITPAEP